MGRNTPTLNTDSYYPNGGAQARNSPAQSSAGCDTPTLNAGSYYPPGDAQTRHRPMQHVTNDKSQGLPAKQAHNKNNVSESMSKHRPSLNGENIQKKPGRKIIPTNFHEELPIEKLHIKHNQHASPGKLIRRNWGNAACCPLLLRERTTSKRAALGWKVISRMISYSGHWIHNFYIYYWWLQISLILQSWSLKIKHISACRNYNQIHLIPYWKSIFIGI